MELKTSNLYPEMDVVSTPGPRETSAKGAFPAEGQGGVMAGTADLEAEAKQSRAQSAAGQLPRSERSAQPHAGA